MFSLSTDIVRMTLYMFCQYYIDLLKLNALHEVSFFVPLNT